MGFFTHSNLSHFVNFTLALPLCYLLEKRRFFANMAASAYHIVFKVKNHKIQNWIFKHTCYINNPHWQISRIIVHIVYIYIYIYVYIYIYIYTYFICKWALSWRCSFCCSLQYYQGFMRNQEVIKIKLLKKVQRRILYLSFDCASSFLYHFFLLSSFTPSSFPSDVLAEWSL